MNKRRNSLSVFIKSHK